MNQYNYEWSIDHFNQVGKMTQCYISFSTTKKSQSLNQVRKRGNSISFNHSTQGVISLLVMEYQFKKLKENREFRRGKKNLITGVPPIFTKIKVDWNGNEYETRHLVRI